MISFRNFVARLATAGIVAAMSDGVILLGEVATRTAWLAVACRVCERSGRLRTDHLLHQHGPAMAMPTLLRILAGDCPRLDSPTITERCDAHSPTLGALFGPKPVHK